MAEGEDEAEAETLAGVWSEGGGEGPGGAGVEMVEATQDEFLALADGSDLQQEEIRWWMCPSEHNGMLADGVGCGGVGVFAASPPLDGQSMRWTDTN